MLITVVCAVVLAQAPAPTGGFSGFADRDLPALAAAQEQLNTLPQPDSLKSWHMLLASEPHIAGTEASGREVVRIRDAFKDMGLETATSDFWPLLSYPESATLEITAPEHLALDLSERPLKEDPSSNGQGFGWNAYSGSGDVTGEVVYVNYGTKADFEQLAQLKVDVKGKVVIARYGGNFRGYKAKFAQEAGAAGLIIYTDPGDSGYAKGLTYPEGGFANDCCIQRGSILTLPYIGDPLTPNEPATEHAKRLAIDAVDLPKIPVQPIAYGTAEKIMSRMKGAAAVPEGWQGGLPFAYRLEGGSDLKVHLAVKQLRTIKQCSNLIATIKGSTYPEQMVIIGCHHDAWNCGAADPLAGTIVLMECAKTFAQVAKEHPPLRTIVFAAWDAEEYGIIGSTEWVEANREALAKNGIAYINLDMASMGPNLNSAASPTLRTVIMDAAAAAPQPGATNQTVLEAWLSRTTDSYRYRSAPATRPVFGDMGGGSDHVGFLCHAGVPSGSIGGGGSKGWSYHSAYDTLPWYWKVVGADYNSALMVTRVTGGTVYRLAYAPLIPLDASALGQDIKRHLETVTKSARDAKIIDAGIDTVASEFKPLLTAGVAIEDHAIGVRRKAEAALAAGTLTAKQLAAANEAILSIDRAWFDSAGLDGRPWFNNLYGAPDEDSGYASWILPGLCRAAANKDKASLIVEAEKCTKAVERVHAALTAMDAALTPEPPKQGL